MPLEKKNTITVCIPTYNQAIYLEESIRSVLSQTRPADEIIISDDASTDETESICRKFVERIPHLRYFRQPKNLGIGGNVEFVMKQARTTFLARVDSDDRILPDYLSKLVGTLEEFPEASYAHGNAWQIDSQGNHIKERVLFRRPGFQTAHDALVASLQGYRVAANILCFRCSTLANVASMEGFDYGEDYFLSVGIARAGYGNVYINEVLAETRVWSDAKGIRARRVAQILQGLIRIYDEQIEPACRETGLPLKMARKARQAYAISFVVVMDNEHSTEAEKENFKSLLIQLGDSWRLRLLITVFQLRLGFIVRAYRRVLEDAKQATKKFLKTFMRSQST